ARRHPRSGPRRRRVAQGGPSRALGLPEHNVRLMRQEAPAAITLMEKWERVAREATAAIVLATPDDEGGLRANRGRPRGGQPRARQNVWLEFGWMWSSLRQRERLLVLTRTGERRESIEVPSDAQAIE